MCLSDNFGVLIHDADAGVTASIDAPEAGPVDAALAGKGWNLTHILVTHHHHDHVGGVEALKKKHGCTVTGPAGSDIPGIDVELADGATFDFGPHKAKIIATPGHTLDHICYWFENDRVLFAADTLFALGCGRVFEGTPPQMWASLQKLMALPRDTVVYCGHEYTQANAKFALTVEPGNDMLQKRAKEIDELRASGKATLPTTIGLELDTNPFLRAQEKSLQEAIGMAGTDPAAVFTEVRTRKDNF